MLLGSSEYRLGMLQNILQYKGQPLTTKNYLALNISDAAVEKPDLHNTSSQFNESNLYRHNLLTGTVQSAISWI